MIFKCRNNLSKLSIRKEVFYTAMFFSTTTLVIFGSFSSYALISANLKKANDSIKSTNSIINTYIEGHIREAANTISVLSKTPAVINAAGNNHLAREKTLNAYKSIAETNENINAIYSGYENGSILINDYIAPPDFDSTKRPWYINAVNSKTKGIEWTLFKDTRSNNWEISVSKVFLTPSGNHAGVVSIDINIKDIERLLSLKKNFNTEHSYIITNSGKIIVHPDAKIIGHYILEISDHITGEEGSFNLSSNHGNRKSYYSTLPHTGWIIITSIDPWEIKLPIILHLVTFLAIVIMLSLLLGIILNNIFYNRFAKPLIDLTRRVEALTSGQVYEDNTYKYSNHETAMIAKNIENLAKDALHKSEEKYSLIADNMADTITIWDLQLNITFASPSVFRLRGFTAEEVMSQNITDMLTPESLKIASKALAQELDAENLENPDPGRQLILDLEQYKKDGSIIWVENRISFIRNKENKATGILVASSDISEKKKADESLKEAKRQAEAANLAKSRFLAGMSHEIRTPLNAILGMTDLSLMTDNDDLVKEYLSIVKKSGHHLLKILNDILDFSKIETGNLFLEKREFSLNNIFTSIDDFFRMDIEKKGINFIINTSANLPSHIRGDEVRIRQILINLVSNAAKFTDTGEITLEADTIQHNSPLGFIPLKISITDTGCGIAPDKQNLIFSKFQQAEMDTTRKYGGSGLGLSIAKEIAELMGGSITVKSEPGKGSKFTLIIFVEEPNYKLEIHKTEPDMQSKEDDYSTKLNILLAEDDEINIRLAITIFKKLGHDVTVARNGIEVIEKLKNNTFDIVVMDVEMPEMDGIEATIQIRDGICGHEKSNIPIIAMTAHAVSDIKRKGLKAGMNDYITKPIDITKINTKIMAVINREQILQIN